MGNLHHPGSGGTGDYSRCLRYIQDFIRFQDCWELRIRASANTSGIPASVVLADEAPHNHQAPIASDHPAASTTPNPSSFTVTSAQEHIISRALRNLQPSQDEIIQRAAQSGGESAPTRAWSNNNPRRRRRSPSADGEPIEPSLETDNSIAAGHRQNPRAVLENSDLSTQGERLRGPSPKRRRLMNKAAMRLDPDTSSSNGPQYHANGSSPVAQKNGISAPTNGHSSPTNGTASPHQNGFFTSVNKKSTTFYGHDREEVTRLLIQGLDDLGYHSAANRLGQESGYEVESPTVAAFRNAILQGQWSEAESLLFGVVTEADGGGVSISNGDWHHLGGLELAEGADLDAMRFSIREQKYLELLEHQDTGKAMMVLRHELQPLHHDRGRLDALSRQAFSQ